MDQEYSSGETGASARIRPIPIFRIVFIVDLMISMFSIVIIGFYSYLWYIVEIAAIMAVYTAGAVAHFNLYTRKQNPRRKFSHFYGRGLSAAIPALIITTTMAYRKESSAKKAGTVNNSIDLNASRFTKWPISCPSIADRWVSIMFS